MSIYFSERAFKRTFGVEPELTFKTETTATSSASLSISTISGGAPNFSRGRSRVIKTEGRISAREALQKQIQNGGHKVIPLAKSGSGDLVEYVATKSIIGGLPILSVNGKSLAPEQQLARLFRRAYPKRRSLRYYWMMAGSLSR